MAATRRQLRGQVLISIAYWLWGYGEDDMPYGPPERGIRARVGWWLYHWGLAVTEQRCPRCGAPNSEGKER